MASPETTATTRLLEHITTAGPVGFLFAHWAVRGRNSDNTLIQKEFGWELSTRLRDGLEVTYRWVYDQLAAKLAKAETPHGVTGTLGLALLPTSLTRNVVLHWGCKSRNVACARPSGRLSTPTTTRSGRLVS